MPNGDPQNSISLGTKGRAECLLPSELISAPSTLISKRLMGKRLWRPRLMMITRAKRVWTPIRVSRRSTKELAICAVLIAGGAVTLVRGADLSADTQVGLAINSAQAPPTGQSNP